MEKLRPDIIEPLTNNHPPQTENYIIPAEVKPPIITESHTREFSLSDMKEEPGKIKIDFFSGDRPNDFIKQPTEAARPVAHGSDNNYINPSINGNSTNPLTPPKSREEIRGSMTILIAIIDYALSTIGHLIAGEGTQSQYTADTPQKKLLETALTDYFYEKQIKMSPVLALFLAFLGAYGFMLGGAFKKRFDRKKKGITDNSLIKKDKPDLNWPSTPPSPYYKAGYTENEIKKITENVKPPALPVTSNGNFGWLTPDEKLVAKNRTELDLYLKKGIYPAFLKNVNNSNTRKIKYDPSTGKPILIGKPARVK